MRRTMSSPTPALFIMRQLNYIVWWDALLTKSSSRSRSSSLSLNIKLSIPLFSFQRAQSRIEHTLAKGPWKVWMTLQWPGYSSDGIGHTKIHMHPLPNTPLHNMLREKTGCSSQNADKEKQFSFLLLAPLYLFGFLPSSMQYIYKY